MSVEGSLEKPDNDSTSEESDGQDDLTISLKQHPSYNQVMLDVRRCAGRVERIKQVYYHKTDDSNEPDDKDYEPYRDIQDLSGDVSDSSSNGALSLTESPESRNKSDSRSCKSEMSSTFSLVMQDVQNKRRLRRKLTNLIVRLLIKKKDLHYYQGFHDVCLSYMIIHGFDEAFTKLDKIIDTHFKTFMQPTMVETQQLLEMIPTIIGLQDSRVQDFLEQTEVGTIFALSWTITWFSHVIPNEEDVERIFKFLETSDPLMVLYLCAAIVLCKKRRLLDLEPEMSTVHHYLCQIPRKEILPIKRLMEDAEEAFKTWPPELVRRKQESHRLYKLQVHNYRLLESVVGRLGTKINHLITTHGRAAIVVIAIGAIAIQLDRWTR